ncbi:TIGR01777 family oxidoreductase, partial [Candidatus Bipolaricaulota bacterium]|nr:TIGR01777 family oxidoreductase [Candidatus Bipolaricaulota bacterium]
RNPAGRKKVAPEVDMVEWDARTPGGWSGELEEADAVVNLAGENIAGSGLVPDRWTEEKKERILNSRLDAGNAVKKAFKAVDHEPEVLVQSSAVGYYGATGDRIVTEGSEPGEDFLAETAVQWEEVTEPLEGMGVRRVVIRTGLVLDTEGGAFPRLLLPFKYFVGGPLGDGQQYYSWIHIQDEARAIRFLLENEAASGPFNLTAPEPVTNESFAKELGRVTGRPSVFKVPGFLIRALFGEAATLVLDGQRAKPEALIEQGFEFRHPNLSGALKELSRDDRG